MASAAESIYQLKITLEQIKPPIWRRVLVPATVTLADLHEVIQAVMPWDDAHLYLFQQGRTRFSEPDPSGSDIGDADSNETFLSEVLSAPKQKLTYLYDFGDSWQHAIELEKILPYDPDQLYPQCIAGKRACPPEDCGGPWGYATMLEALKDPKHPEHELYVDWMDEDFDPEEFDVEEANEFLSMGLFLGDDEPPMAPINRHLVVLSPTQAYFKLRKRLQKSNPGVFNKENIMPLAFLVPMTPDVDELKAVVEDLMPMFTAMQLLTEISDPMIIAELGGDEVEDLFSYSLLPLVFDLDWKSPLIHLSADLIDEAFEQAFEED